MDGILIPILGLLASIALGLLCLILPRFRRFTLPALITPFLTSGVFLVGAFILADMNPAREYGAAYVLTGKEHDPSALDYFLWLLATTVTMVLSAIGGYLIQRAGVELFSRSSSLRSLFYR